MLICNVLVESELRKKKYSKKGQRREIEQNTIILFLLMYNGPKLWYCEYYINVQFNFFINDSYLLSDDMTRLRF